MRSAGSTTRPHTSPAAPTSTTTPGRITFSEFYADWATRQVWAPGTVLAMKLAAGSVPFADVPLRSLRRSHVEGWVKGMVNKGLAPGTVHTRVNNVRAVLRGAVADRLIPSDP